MNVERESMRGVDAAWLHMDEPTNLMVINGLMFFESPMKRATLEDILNNRLLKFKRFRQRITEKKWFLGTPRWETVPQVDMNYHLQEITLPDPGDDATLRKVVDQWLSKPLSYDYPLWQVLLIHNYKSGAVVYVRIHHCIADGIALVKLLLSLRDDDNDMEPNHFFRKMKFDKRLKLFSQKKSFLGKVIQFLLEAFSIIRLALYKPDPRTIFKGKLGVEKCAAWSDAIPLREIKEIGKANQATINDVVLSAVSGALHQYMKEKDAPISEDLNIRAAVPFNLRDPEEELELGNNFGLIFLSLPVGIKDPLQRLEALKVRSRQLKQSPQPLGVLGVLGLIGRLPHVFEKLVVQFFGTKLTAIMTNVPGPPEAVKIANNKIDRILFWVPQSGRAGMGVSIFSYCEKIWLGISTDKGLVPDPERLIELYYQELERLKNISRPTNESANVA